MTTAALLYDADCGLCRWSLARVLAWDRRGALRPVAIQSAEGAALLPDLTEPERLASWHLVAHGAPLASAGAAVPPLMRLLPGGAPIAAVAARFPRTVEATYQAVVRNRSTLGRLVTPGAAARARTRIQNRTK